MQRGRFWRNKEMYTQLLLLIIGTFVMSIAVVSYFDAIEVVAGGVTGLAVLFENLWSIPIWVVNIMFNIPLFLISFKVLRKRTFYKTILGTGLLTLFLGIVPRLHILTGDMLVDIIIGSVLMGVGLGFVFLGQASSGGVDLLSTILHKRIKYLSVPKLMGLIDAVIVVAGALAFGVTKGIYALIAVYIIERTADAIVEGPNHAKLLYIITKKEKTCATYIIEEIERGVTYIPVVGAYTNEPKRMIMCAVSGKEMVKIKQKIYQIDENAICFIGDIREAFGEGFTKLGVYN